MLRRLCLAVLAIVPTVAAHAASLLVTPISVERVAPATAATLTLRNGGRDPFNVQVRIFRWSNGAHGDVLTPTGDVIVSPPVAYLAPGVDYTVRIVRVSADPVTREEPYRVLVDQLPAPDTSAGNSVRLLLRYSLPVFFRPADLKAADIHWSLTRSGSEFVLTAQNVGARHLRVSEVELVAGGKTLPLLPGLAGYVLASSSQTWRLTAPPGSPASGSALLRFATDAGATDVPVVIATAH